MENITRNDPSGFARFGLKNLEFIEQAAKDDPALDLHPVTQLALSLLGVIVFQREAKTLEKNPKVHSKKLTSLDSQWRMSPSCDTVGELVDHLRHAVAHGHVSFSSGSRQLHEVEVSFSNPPKRWTGSIQADALREFCYRLMQLLEETD
jgi:hypothetical protein